MPPVAASGEPGALQQSSGRQVDWAALAPRAADFEDAMNAAQVAKVWAKMYKAAKMPNGGEAEQAAFRMAVYVYAAKNGTSREGNYKGQIVTSNGFTFEASVIPFATGKMAIRKFFRGCMQESYEALKTSGVMEADDRFVARAADLQIPADCAFAMADWMADCPYFTPAEKIAHDRAFVRGISRARRARDGHTLEGVEEGRTAHELEAQGPLAGHEIKF